MSINAIVLIVLAVVVLVILIVGFAVGWGNIAPWLSKDNVNTIVNQCGSACSVNSIYDYSTKMRDLNDGINKIKATCAIFSTVTNFKDYGVATCPYLDSTKECEGLSINDKKGLLTATNCLASEYDLSELASDADGTTNWCCIRK